jgi:GTP-binding protein HflX
MQLSREISRQIGILVSRRGLVEYVIVGDYGRIRIPPLSTERVGRARFRGVRMIHTHLGGELLSKEDLSDLATLQLDLVACITERPGEPGQMIHISHLIPESRQGRAWDFIGPMNVSDLSLDFTDFITELENEFVRERGRFYVLDQNKDKCIIVSVVPRKGGDNREDRIMELKDLCYSAGITVVDTVIQKPKELHPQHLIGKGKMEEIVIRCQQLGIDLLVFDRGLSPGQIKNISLITDLRVVDRNQLILDIFASRAHTKESKIQVELAQLGYILPRLAEKNTAFSRLTGGIGARGPGETKLEVDRRRIREKIAFLEKKLTDIRKVRAKKRERRLFSGIPIVSIVGYTNSGKSTLLNLLTKSAVEAENKAFSTLTPTTRLIKYPERRKIIVTDTVGFIRDLPEVLLRAFMATLEELDDADLLLHLVDVSSPDYEEHMEAVEDVLRKLSLNEKRRLLVFNKTDRIDGELVGNLAQRYNAVSISCLKKEGIENLVATIEAELSLPEPEGIDR